MSEAKISKYKVKGLRCESCVLLIEDELSRVGGGIAAPQVDLAKNELTVRLDGDVDAEDAARRIAALIAPHGYALDDGARVAGRRSEEFLIAVPAAAAFVAAFVLLQRSGLMSFDLNGDVGFGASFLIGLTASISSCLAVVGGLILSLSAAWAKAGRRRGAALSFHVGRLAGFFLLGGLVGLVGQAARVSSTTAAWLGIAVSLVMIALGLDLLDLFDWTRRIKLRLPKAFGRMTLAASRGESAAMPLLVGVGTFFLPCGFTQSMQLSALATGEFLAGGLLMLAFALGTLPVLALVSFGSFEASRLPWRGTFFRAAGLVIILLAALNLWGALAAVGVLPPVSFS